MRRKALSNFLVLGEVVRPHGLKGLLQIRSFARSPDSFLEAGEVFLKDHSGKTRCFRVLSAKPHKKGLLLALDGLNSIDVAEQFRGAQVLAEKQAFKKEEDGEYFWHELLGLSVYLDTGDYIGKISQIIPTGSNDVYVVREGKKEFLIPGIYEVVKKIDLAAGKMIVCPLEGMLDLDEV